MDTANNHPEHEPRAASNDYLWDGSGNPDPEIQKLETLLREFRHDRQAPQFPEIVPQTRWTFSPWRLRLFPALAATAAFAVAIAAILFLSHGTKPPVAGPGWDVSRLSGTPRIGSISIRANEKPSRLGVGQVLETDDQSRASLQSEGIGQIEIDPGTRLRLLAMVKGLKHIALDHGTIHAFIWAPPGQFVVDTPSATTVDLGCSYTLHVDDSGAGIVRTSLGWVGFKLHGHEAFIPAGAACATRPKVGPGTPYFEDAPAEFRAALARFDFDDTTPQQRADHLALILAQSRQHDALTLWHLLSRVDDRQRTLVLDRLSQLAPAPAGVTRVGILRLDQPMLDLWWNSLGFDDISIWRHWEHSWSAETTSGAATSGAATSGATTPSGNAK